MCNLSISRIVFIHDCAILRVIIMCFLCAFLFLFCFLCSAFVVNKRDYYDANSRARSFRQFSLIFFRDRPIVSLILRS